MDDSLLAKKYISTMAGLSGFFDPPSLSKQPIPIERKKRVPKNVSKNRKNAKLAKIARRKNRR